MKQTKRLLTWILAVVMIVASVALVACVDKPTAKQLTELTVPKLKEGQMAVIIKNGDNDYTSYTVTLTEEMKTGEDVLQYLLDAQTLTIDWADSDLGKYINVLGDLHPDSAKKQFVAVLTSVEKDKANWAGAQTYEVGDVTLVASQFGVSQMTVESGAVIYFEIETY